MKILLQMMCLVLVTISIVNAESNYDKDSYLVVRMSSVKYSSDSVANEKTDDYRLRVTITDLEKGFESSTINSSMYKEDHLHGLNSDFIVSLELSELKQELVKQYETDRRKLLMEWDKLIELQSNDYSGERADRLNKLRYLGAPRSEGGLKLKVDRYARDLNFSVKIEVLDDDQIIFAPIEMIGKAVDTYFSSFLTPGYSSDIKIGDDELILKHLNTSDFPQGQLKKVTHFKSNRFKNYPEYRGIRSNYLEVQYGLLSSSQLETLKGLADEEEALNIEDVNTVLEAF